MSNKKVCPICENPLSQNKENHYCTCCSWYKEITTNGEKVYHIGSKRTFKEEERADMNFFILLKRKELRDLIRRLIKLKNTFSKQAERASHLCDTEEKKVVWKNIQENQELALQTLKKLTQEGE